MSTFPESAADSRPFRLVIAGCGAITASSHLPAALRSPRVEVAALVDPSTDRAEALARQFGILPRVCRRLEEALETADGVLVATPNHTHLELAAAGMERGLPVLVEKPMTAALEEADRLCALAKERKVVVAVGFSTRFYPAVELMGRLLERKYFGAVRSLRYEFGTRGGWAPLSSYNLDRKAAGGGVVTVTGSHFLDRVIAWFGYPEVSEYRDDSFGGPEANAMGRLRFSPPGSAPFEAVFLLSKTAKLKNRLELETEAGVCELEESESAEICLRPATAPDLLARISPSHPPGAVVRAAQAQLEDFVAAVREGRPPRVGCEAGRLSVKLTAELYATRQPLPEPWMWYAVRRPEQHA